MSAVPRAALIAGLLCCLAAAGALLRGTASAASPAGAVVVSASLEPAEIRVGDTASLTVSVEHPAAGSVALPEIGRGKAIRVGDTRRKTTVFADGEKAGRARTTFVVSFTSFEVGEHGLGGGTVEYADQEGTRLAAPVPATVLRTRSLLQGEATPMRGIREPARWPASRRWRFALAGAALLLAAATLFLGLRRGRSRRAPHAAGPPARPPHQVALGALAALRGRQPLDERQLDQWYREVSSIVRRYFEEAFALQAPERTTEEFISEAAASGRLAPAQRELARAFLDRCDLVKFARHRPAAVEIAEALAAAERLVRETVPSPARQAPAGGSARR